MQEMCYTCDETAVKPNGGEKESMHKGSHTTWGQGDIREGVVSLECLENETVKSPCPYGDNTVEREEENNYEAYQGNFLVSTKHWESKAYSVSAAQCRAGTALCWRPVSGIAPDGVPVAATQQTAEV